MAVHLAIGQIYAYSVFNAPLTKLIGITESAAGDWKLTTVGWIFSIALAMLGASVIFNSSFPQKRESGSEKPQEFVGKNRNLSVHPKCFRRRILGRIKTRPDIFL
ncbi:hypothetical protein BC463_02890 [Neisseria meningitidis]|nr:hypothetical protein BC463_02890 [Neisseria meningitidis]